MVLATFTSRKPAKYYAVRPVADKNPLIYSVFPWRRPTGAPFPQGRIVQAQGQLQRNRRGGNPQSTSIEYVAVEYHNFSDDGKIFLPGNGNATTSSESPTLNRIECFSDLTHRGPDDTLNTKVTGGDGFRRRRVID
jgi:hypothetical protein